MNQGSFNKQAMFLQTLPQLRNISATVHAISCIHEPPRNKTDGLTVSLWRYASYFS